MADERMTGIDMDTSAPKDGFSPDTLMELLNSDPAQARKYLRQYAQQGVAVAQWNYADALWFAVGGEKDTDEAYVWYLKAAKQGITEAFLGLANIHFNEKDKKHYNPEVGTEFLKKAADLGHVPAQFALACAYSQSERYDEALQYFEMAAEQGHISAQYFAGYQYYLGYGARIDFSKAVTWLSKTIENPNEGPNAVDNPTDPKMGAFKLLGDAYEHGNGVPVDMDQANAYYRRAQELGGSVETEKQNTTEKFNVTAFYRENASNLICVRDRCVCAIDMDGRGVFERTNILDNYSLLLKATNKLFTKTVEPSQWTGLRQILRPFWGVMEKDVLVGLKRDGQVLLAGHDAPFVFAERWSDIVSVKGGNGFLVGLKKDGSVMLTGDDVVDHFCIDTWKDIVSLSCGANFVAGLRKDGTVVATGMDPFDACDTKSWKHIKAIECTVHSTVGLREDGTVVVAGEMPGSMMDAQGWRSIEKLFHGSEHVVGLKTDGTVVAAGKNPDGRCNVYSWKNIISIACGIHHTVALREDGRVEAVGSNEMGQCNVQRWRDIVAIAAGRDQTVGITKYGEVLRTNYDVTAGALAAKFAPNPNSVKMPWRVFHPQKSYVGWEISK